MFPRPMDISVVIVNWNIRDILRDCLSSVFKQTQGIEFEVIVVDNGSSDRSVQMLEDEFPRAIIIANANNRGFAAANNQGIAVSKGRYVLLLNSDTVVLDNTIARTISFADKHKDAAVIGCRVLNPDRTLQISCFMFPSILNMFLSATCLYKLFPRSKFFGRERMTWWNRDDARDVDVATGCFILVRREAIEQVGVMDERFFMYGEETDWCYRFKQAGWKILFTPDAEIIHFGGQSSKQAVPAMSLQLRGSILQFFEKHRSNVEYRLACFFVLMFFVFRIPVWFARWIVDRRNRGYCWMRMKIYVVGTWRLLTGGAKALCVR